MKIYDINGNVLHDYPECDSVKGIIEKLGYRANLEGADLRGANLRSADLRGANLRSADLRGADLGSADLRSADLRGADLGGADLGSADLRGADLRSADLEGADLRSADLEGADLEGANLRGADLGSADLRGADLRCADLEGADLFKKGVISLKIHQISGFNYHIFILDNHIKIGCELHTKEEWKSFTDEEILQMDGKNALRFWNENKNWIMSMADAATPKMGVV